MSKTETVRDLYADMLAPERAVIANCLIQPKLIPDIIARVKPRDIERELHQRVLEFLASASDEGRVPSIETVAALYGDQEIEAGTSVRKYLMEICSEALKGAYLPWQDSVEVVIDRSRRKRLAAIGSNLMQSSGLAVKASDLAADTVAQIDEVLSEMRSDRRLAYNAEQAGGAAIDHLESDAKPYPTTGLADLDNMIGGWPPGQLSVLAGRPGAGKSAVASSMLLRSAKDGNAAAFFSLEMTKEQLGARMLTDLAYVGGQAIFYEDILNRRITDERVKRRLVDARERLKSLPVHIEEQRGLTVSEIAARSRKLAAKLEREGQSLKLVFVDHMMLVKATDRYSGNRVREVGEISEGLTLLAQELDCAVVALCQLNRNVEGRDNKRPTLSDLRDSGEVEQNASTVTFLYRPAYYLEQMRYDDPDLERERVNKLVELRNVLELSVAKNRNGRVGVVEAFADIGANAIRNKDFGQSRRAA